MSLVAYTVESDDESDSEESAEETNKAIVIQKPTVITQTKKTIDDEVDDFFEGDALLLAQKNNINTSDNKALVFAQLPAPKKQSHESSTDEKEDEFLHKPVATNKVKISIPSLREFDGINMTYKNENRNEDAPLRRATTAASKSSKLLTILPRAKSEQNFLKPHANKSTLSAVNVIPSTLPAPSLPSVAKAGDGTAAKFVKSAAKCSLIPDSVRLGRAGRNTEEQLDVKPKLTAKKRKLPADNENDDDDGTDVADFFSLNDNTEDVQQLPAVSLTEINAMLAERTAKLAAKTTAHLQSTVEHMDTMETIPAQSNISNYVTELDTEALRTLAGRKAVKRAHRGEEPVQIMDINSSEVLPNRDEWMRTALAASTSYQPTGTLTDEEPAAGTRRKHQITYLAHKAKANEAELQAMWAANRQTRRATQSKYGF